MNPKPMQLICRSFLSYVEIHHSIKFTFNVCTTFTSRPIPLPRKMKNNISENPSRSPLSCPVPFPRQPSSLNCNVHATLVSPQESVLLRYYRHERPIDIVRSVLMRSIKSIDNSQGKCGRYKLSFVSMLIGQLCLCHCPVQ